MVKELLNIKEFLTHDSKGDLCEIFLKIIKCKTQLDVEKVFIYLFCVIHTSVVTYLPKNCQLARYGVFFFF